MQEETRTLLRRIAVAAATSAHISGLTHRHYRYPARFSPDFVGAVIDALSKPGQLVLDPFMGGGTTVVEALARGRNVVGCDLNALAVFVARAKTAHLTSSQQAALEIWASRHVPLLSYRDPAPVIPPHDDIRTRNLHLPRARPMRKFFALALVSLGGLPDRRTQEFARCALLNVGQWALNGKRTATTLGAVRERLSSTILEMLNGARALSAQSKASGISKTTVTLINARSSELPDRRPFRNGARANLVVTSPPYPGIHVLYHRWQVDGRKETPAPYWIANCYDGQGASYYNFASRKDETDERYFDELRGSFSAVRKVVTDDAYVVQLVAFAQPRRQLKRYLSVMESCGFTELSHHAAGRPGRRVWRNVPQRNWHANLGGATNSSKEILLIHRAK